MGGAILRSTGRDFSNVGKNRRKLGRRPKPPKYPELHNRDWLFIEYVVKGRIDRDIAKDVGCTPSAVGQARRRNGILGRDAQFPVHVPELHDRDWLEYEYVLNDRGSHDIAKQLGCTPSAVDAARWRLGIPDRPHLPKPPRVCSIDGCPNPHFGRGWCHMHHERYRRTGTTDPPKPQPRVPPTCSADDCHRQAIARGWCHRHYERWWRARKAERAAALHESGRERIRA